MNDPYNVILLVYCRADALHRPAEFHQRKRYDVGRLFRCAREMSRSDRERRVRQTDPTILNQHSVGVDAHIDPQNLIKTNGRS